MKRGIGSDHLKFAKLKPFLSALQYLSHFSLNVSQEKGSDIYLARVRISAEQMNKWHQLKYVEINWHNLKSIGINWNRTHSSGNQLDQLKQVSLGLVGPW